eukprot:scaffold1175_cov330-Prasinococcus_capsulatus_cf.AAC.8
MMQHCAAPDAMAAPVAGVQREPAARLEAPAQLFPRLDYRNRVPIIPCGCPADWGSNACCTDSPADRRRLLRAPPPRGGAGDGDRGANATAPQHRRPGGAGDHHAPPRAALPLRHAAGARALPLFRRRCC